MHFFTDKVIFERVLLNMGINALEATSPQRTIHIGCFKGPEGYCRFWVQNDSVISRELQNSICNFRK